MSWKWRTGLDDQSSERDSVVDGLHYKAKEGSQLSQKQATRLSSCDSPETTKAPGGPWQKCLAHNKIAQVSARSGVTAPRSAGEGTLKRNAPTGNVIVTMREACLHSICAVNS